MIEPELKALNDTVAAYRKLTPNSEIVPVQATVAEALKRGLPHADMTLANHPLDDMIIGETVDERTFQRLFHNHYEKPVNFTRSLWDRLDKNRTDSIFHSICQQWSGLKKLSTKVIISQYDSYFFQVNNFSRPDKVAFELMCELRKQYNTVNIGANVENKYQWLAA